MVVRYHIIVGHRAVSGSSMGANSGSVAFPLAGSMDSVRAVPLDTRRVLESSCFNTSTLGRARWRSNLV